MITHRSIIHATCPLDGAWDYYSVHIQTSEFVDVAEIEKILDRARGCQATQETIARTIKRLLGSRATVTLTGRHSQNTKTTVTL